jgi:hypothetical protein
VKDVRELKTTAKVAPKITFDDVFGDERMAISKAQDAANPEFVHIWMPQIDVTKQGPGKNRESTGIEHGNDVLVREPRAIYEQKRLIMEERSYQTAAKTRGLSGDEVFSTGNMKQFAKDVKK